MSVGAGSHPTDDSAIVPDRLIADGIDVGGIDDKSDETQLTATRPLLHGCGPTEEVTLLESDETAETGLVGTIDGAVLPRPGAEALLDAHGIERAPAKGLQAPLGAGRPQELVERALIVGRYPDLVTQLTGEGDSAHPSRDHADIQAAEAQEGERGVGEVIAHEALQQ